jgi:hypothetical protein
VPAARLGKMGAATAQQEGHDDSQSISIDIVQLIAGGDIGGCVETGAEPGTTAPTTVSFGTSQLTRDTLNPMAPPPTMPATSSLACSTLSAPASRLAAQ